MVISKVEICGVNTSKLPILTSEQKKILFEKILNGDEAARQEYIYGNLRLVLSVIKRFSNRGENMDDLFQVGCIGLIKAIDNFDVSHGVMFSTYAVPMILGEIKRYIRDDGRIKVSRQMKTDIKRMKIAREEYYYKHGTSPKLSELARELELSTERVLEIIEADDALCNFESIDDPESAKQYSSVKTENFVAAEDKIVDVICLKNIIGKLEDKERKIIVLRYFKDMTQQQIANLLGISQVQVSRIEKRVLENIRMVCEK